MMLPEGVHRITYVARAGRGNYGVYTGLVCVGPHPRAVSIQLVECSDVRAASECIDKLPATVPYELVCVEDAAVRNGLEDWCARPLCFIDVAAPSDACSLEELEGRWLLAVSERV